MTTNYNEDELNLLAALPQMVGAAMAFSGSSGLFGTGKEMFVSAQSVLAGVKDYPHNDLIQAVLPNLQGDRSEAMGKMNKFRDWATARMKEKGINTYEKMRELALEDCRAAVNLLSAKSSSQEATEYKQWALSVAEKVAMHPPKGAFLVLAVRG